ncbi:MAG: carboxypeptidase-like regulatory domain-containing protein [Acidobacteria bacterium]|nr:carboxypeptidase-like regulatory domain-containing protein [Acidobacteriota bacterium]
MNNPKFPAPFRPRPRRASSLTTLALCALALCAAPPAAAQPAAETPARDKGTINVRVLGEDNQPVAGAFVTAFQQGSTARVSYDNSGAASGRYVLTNLDPGVYRVSALAPGYVEETDPAADPAEPRHLYRPGDSVTIRLTKGGVITGKVTDADGGPVVGARIVAVRVRDGAGRVLRQTGPVFSSIRERRTDDRGVYRLYGVPSGAYIVMAGGRTGVSFGARPSAYDSHAPTYYPSATRDGAAEVQVQAGQEVTDIDIRHRGEQGYAVSGTVVSAGDLGPGGASVILKHTSSGAAAAFAFVYGNPADGTRSFNFEGVADGDYEISASGNALEKETGAASAPLRVTVRGADVTGLRLALAPLGSIAGRVSFEPLAAADAKRAECQNLRAPVPQESLVFTRREDAATPSSPFTGPREIVPDPRGDFVARNLEPGRYRFALRLIDDSLFLRAVTMRAGETAPAAATPGAAAANANPASSPQTPAVAAAAARAASDLARNGFGIKAGERLAGVRSSSARARARSAGGSSPRPRARGCPTPCASTSSRPSASAPKTCPATTRRGRAPTARSHSATSRPAATCSSRGASRKARRARPNRPAPPRGTPPPAPNCAARPRPRGTPSSCNPASAPKTSRSGSAESRNAER